jgi:hypothetical protein
MLQDDRYRNPSLRESGLTIGNTLEDSVTSRRAALVCLSLWLGWWPLTAAAQSATPTTSSSARLDLAAIALSPQDVPGGFFDDYSEWWVPGATFADAVAAPTPAGLERVYESFYYDVDEPVAVHNFLFEFASPEDATAGFAIVDPSLRPALPDGAVVGPKDAAGPELGDGPSQITTVSYDTRAEGGPLVDVLAIAFQRDRLIAGVSIERYTDPAPEGAPEAEAATPIAMEPGADVLAQQLVSTLDERIKEVLAGEMPSGVDRSLSEVALPIDQLVDDQTPVLGGYKAGADLLRCGICGEENSLLPFADDARGGFSRTVSLGPMVDGEPSPPFVTVAVSTFTSPDVAQAVLAAIRQAPNDLPTSGPIPRGKRTLADEPDIPDTTAALAYHGSMDDQDPNAPVDSAGVDFVVGNQLATVDVQGGLSAEDALAAAVDLAHQQASCLAAGGPCVTVTLPPSIQSASGS